LKTRTLLHVKKYFQTVLGLLRSWRSALQDMYEIVQVELQEKKHTFQRIQAS